MTHRLILIEGMPGAGKSTTAAYIGSALDDAGLPNRWFHELAEDHPIADLDVALPDYPDRWLIEWRRLVALHADDPATLIIESRLWHNSAMFLYMHGTPWATITALNATIAEALAPLNPALLHLVHTNIPASLEHLARDRGDEWMAWAFQLTDHFAWFQQNGRSSLETWQQFFCEWEPLAHELFGAWPHAKLQVVNPFQDWTAAHERILAWLRLT